jgi:splicing factor 3A subunit 3
MNSVLESTRQLHEDLESLEAYMAATLAARPRSQRGSHLCDLQLAALLRASSTVAAALAAAHGGCSLRGEAAALRGEGALELFYARLEEARQAAGEVGGAAAEAAAVAAAAAAAAAPVAAALPGAAPAAAPPPAVAAAALAAAAATLEAGFSRDEVYGRYIDLAGLFEEWANLPGLKEARAAAVAAAGGGEGGGGGGENPAAAAAASPFSEWAALDYCDWLRALPRAHAGLPPRAKQSRGWRRYIHGAAARLLRFSQLRAPLVDFGEVLAAWAGEWAATGSGSSGGADNGDGGDGDGGGGSGGAPPALPAPPSPAPLDHYPTPEAMVAALGSEGLRRALAARGAKAGGTDGERAARLWAIKQLPPGAALPAKLRAAGAGGAAGGEAPPAAPAPAPAAPSPLSALPALDPVDALPGGAARATPAAAAAWCEEVFLRLAGCVEEVLAASRRRLERRATKTFTEVAAERAAEEEDAAAERRGEIECAGGGGGGGDDDDDDEGAPIYNPLDLPLDWDGKPIPFWLYKLHGLNKSFSCEICGGAVIRGRRDFDRHFQEARHAAGMRALGIPNTKAFHDITKIKDARTREWVGAKPLARALLFEAPPPLFEQPPNTAVHSKLLARLDKAQWNPDKGQDYEDSQGNVLDRKTFEDLAKMGFL